MDIWFLDMCIELHNKIKIFDSLDHINKATK